MTAKTRPEQIMLFTDFGEQGPYLGQMESVLHQAGVSQPIVRLLSDAPRCNPRAAAYLLAALADSITASSVFLAVVDPGVGGPRRLLLVPSGRHWFVGPDNGLLSQVVRTSVQRREPRVIDWRPERLSASFHGRDLFAPVTAEVCLGRTPPGSPMDLDQMVGADWPDDLAEVVYIDHYGNVMTGISASGVDRDTAFRIGTSTMRYARTFSAVSPKAGFWYENSIGLVELAVNQGTAAEKLGLEIGSVLTPA